MCKCRTKLGALTFGAMLSVAVTAPLPAHAGNDPFVGELMLVGFNFCPRSWTEADGQLLQISSNTALFSLYGTIFGGDGRTTFALPDLRGRAPIHFGNGPGLSPYNMGQKGGTEGFILTGNQMPSHNHNVKGVGAVADKFGPNSDFLAVPNPLSAIYHDGPPDKTMDPAMITNTGGGQQVVKRSPFLTMRWCVALDGVYPSRN